MSLSLTYRYQVRQFACFFIDAILSTLCLYLSYFIRFDGDLPLRFKEMIGPSILLALPVRLFLYWLLGCYRFSYLGLSLNEILKIIKSISLGSIITPFVLLVFHIGVMPRSVMIIEWFLLVVTLSINHVVFLEFSSTVTSLRIGKLLKREETKFEIDEASNFFAGQKVLITGAAGSIGTKLAQAISEFSLEKLILIDQNESELVYTQLVLSKNAACNIEAHVANVAQDEMLGEIFANTSPTIVFHAAAYKHVPMGEADPKVFIYNNLLALKNVATQCSQHKVRKCVYISSDKAVNPVSVMGATKRIGELYLQSIKQTPTKFMTVRFGNVINSRGSVVPIWQEQIRKRENITITDFNAERYFMGMNEAVSLIVQSTVLGQGGELFVLDMGEPVKIVELAYALAEVLGISPRNLKFDTIGLRPGEKISEALYFNYEQLFPTSHEKINLCKSTKNAFLSEVQLENLINLCLEPGSDTDVVAEVQQIVTEFQFFDRSMPTQMPRVAAA
ncbi:MAG: polysaccharide biosynthesis protein [Deltaproteobacteria bacterium]|nr:polysaccharide biosynthesis protein [Deltaproteobacteria bacterium]